MTKVVCLRVKKVMVLDIKITDFFLKGQATGVGGGYKINNVRRFIINISNLCCYITRSGSPFRRARDIWFTANKTL